MITNEAIREYGTFTDRTDSFDDRKELKIFTAFLQEKNPSSVIVVKPYGPYGVDLGMFDEKENVKITFDLERCKAWGDDWPEYWQSLSFLARKDKHLVYPNFGMVWFNCAMTKFVIAWKEDIEQFPVSVRTFKGKTQTDRVRKVDFQYGTLFGPSFAPRETKLFADRIVWNRR